MTRQRTGTSSSYGTTDPAFVGAGPDAPSKAGLVLLYARNFEQFHPAYPFHHPTVVIGRAETSGKTRTPRAAPPPMIICTKGARGGD